MLEAAMDSQESRHGAGKLRNAFMRKAVSHGALEMWRSWGCTDFTREEMRALVGGAGALGGK